MAEIRFCPKCGKEVAAGTKAKFCLKCGAKFDLAAAPAQAAETVDMTQSSGPVTCPICKMGNPVHVNNCTRCKATLRPELIELALRSLPAYDAGPAPRQNVASCAKCGAMLSSAVEWCTSCGSTIVR